MTDPDRHPVDLLAEEFADRLRRGEHPSVAEYARSHPDLADQLREVLPSIAMIERLKQQKQSGASAVREMPKLERLGDFRIIREAGRGGMGIVYEAVQESLDRHVALKVLPRHAMLDPLKKERFELEARAAARLHHTNIVPVFGVGEDDGLHYFVMQYIEGRGINQIIAALAVGKPVTPPAVPRSDAGFWKWVAGVGLQVADALRYAHEQGTLHRDIKPANLLLDHHGTVWVTDFGLAKLTDQREVTRTGDIIGTLQYMAPESLKGQADARSDVYCLGLTLYELLTLRRPFGDSHPAELIRRIAETDPPRPRSIDPAIPRDLETIILKAMSREPAGRYPTAEAMAEDLQNYLHDRPIQARRVTSTERLWRWCRRNRAVAALTAATIVSVLAGLIVGWIGYVNTQYALGEEYKRRQEAEVATKRADANVALSLRAFEDIFNELADRDSLRMGGPQLGIRRPFATPPMPPSTEDAALLQSILAFYDEFARQNTTNPLLQAEAARAYRRMGEIYARLDEPAKADAAMARAAAIYQELLRDSPAVPRYRHGLVDACSKLAVRELDPAEIEPARHRLAQAAQIAGEVLAASRDDPELAILAGGTWLRLGAVLEQAGDPAGAEAWYRRAVDSLRAVRLPPLGGPDRPDRPGRPDHADRPRGMVAQNRFLQLSAAQLLLAELLASGERTDESKRIIAEVLRDADEVGRSIPPPGRDAGQFAAVVESAAMLAKRLGDEALAARATAQASRIRQLPSPGPRGNPDPGRPPGR